MRREHTRKPSPALRARDSVGRIDRRSSSSAMAKPRIDIEYCPRCGWMLRATWLAQELLTTFADDISMVSLVPASISGIFQVTVDDVLVWCRKADHGFPQAAELKQRVRDRVAPGRSLGHTDAKET